MYPHVSDQKQHLFSSDRRIRDAWLATYALLWIFVVGATAFFAWRFYVRPDNRCACGVGWVYRCAEHQPVRGLMQNDFICDSNGCKCDSGLVCDAPDLRSATRRWGALLIGVQALAMATSAVLWQWDRLFLGGFELFFRVDDEHTEPWDIPGRVNSADATITLSVLSWVMLTAVVPWVMFYDRCVVVTQSLVVLGWFAMNVVIMVSNAEMQAKPPMHSWPALSRFPWHSPLPALFVSDSTLTPTSGSRSHGPTRPRTACTAAGARAARPRTGAASAACGRPAAHAAPTARRRPRPW